MTPVTSFTSPGFAMPLVRSLLFNVVFFAWTTFMVLLAIPTLILPKGALWWVARLWIAVVLRALDLIVGIRVEIRGRENLPKGACIVAAKHQSALETLVLAVLLDRPSFVLKRELTWIPLFGWYLLKLKMVDINRAKGGLAVAGMVARARKVASTGRPIIIFPEGTRRAPGAPPRYRRGILALYEALHVPIVPVALNSGLFWGRRSFVKKPGTVVIEVLPHIPPDLPVEQARETMERVIEQATNRLLSAA